jgi:hypothetical protein
MRALLLISVIYVLTLVILLAIHSFIGAKLLFTSLERALRLWKSVWLNLNQIATLFERDKSVISRHLGNMSREGELEPDSVLIIASTLTSVQPGLNDQFLEMRGNCLSYSYNPFYISHRMYFNASPAIC